MIISKRWNYDYANRCECAEDDRCGCEYPENMGRGFNKTLNTYQNNDGKKNTIVGEQAVNFMAPAVMSDGTVNEIFNFFDYISDNYVLLLFYLADFSAICPKEITAFNQICDDMRQQGVKTVAVSVDSVEAHIAWKKMSFSDGGIGQVNFPLVSDLSKNISRQYGVLRKDGRAQRATFLIDKNYNIRYLAVYDKKLERSAAETKRIVEKIMEQDEAECKGVGCWLKNDKERSI